MYFACREVYLVWLTGIRILAEGSVIEYYGDGGYRYAGGTKYRVIVLVVITGYIQYDYHYTGLQ